MSNLIIEPTKNTPLVSFDLESNQYVISGVSTPMNAMEFYAPVMNWIKDNLDAIADAADFRIELPYYNSASMKTILMTLQEIKKGCDLGKHWSISWVVEDEDEFMQEGGESFQELLEFEFNFIEKNS